MSAEGNYMRISPEKLAELIRSPDSVWDYISSIEQSVEATARYIRSANVAWQGIHFLLNSEAWGGTKPFWNVILGGTPFVEGVISEDSPGHFITTTEAIWETVRYLTPDEVKDVASALNQLEQVELERRFSIPSLVEAEIYQFDHLQDDAETRSEEFRLIYEIIVDITNFFETVAESGDAMLLYLS